MEGLASATRPLSPFRSGHMSISGVSSRRDSHATSSSSSAHSVTDPNPSLLSCVTKETAQDDCARHRFILWAAVRRNASIRMTADEKLECPLLRCTQRSVDHESMLKHLAGCPYLASGEYWCYDHMRVERFDDLKCKRCLGHPSRRKKMLSMAKNFFHGLGQKQKKGGNADEDDADDIFAPARPPSSCIEKYSLDPLIGNSSELSATEIVEIDSTEVKTAAQDQTAVIDPQDLLIPSIPELDSAMQWQPTTDMDEPILPFNTPAIQLGLSTCGLAVQGLGKSAPRLAPRPILTAPRSKGLSPSSSVRSNASTDSTDSNVSTSSNVSATSQFSTASNSSSLVSPISNYSSTWSVPAAAATAIVPPEGLLGQDCALAADPAFPGFEFFELPADAPTTMANGPGDILNLDSTLFSFDAFPTADGVYAEDIVVPSEGSSDAAKMDGLSVGLRDDEVIRSETKTLVGSAWDALQEHIVSSMLKIRAVEGNPVAEELRTITPRTMAATGLQTLRSLLAGVRPSAATDTLCFIHLVYAFSLVLHEQDAPHVLKDLFLQSLSYAQSLLSPQRDWCASLVFNIWEPADVTQDEISKYFATGSNRSQSRSSTLKGKQPAHVATAENGQVDALLVAAQNFMDEFEAVQARGHQPMPIKCQQLDSDSKTTTATLEHAAQFVLDMLLRAFLDVTGLAAELDTVYRKVILGEISSARGLELGFYRAGQGCMSSLKFCCSFAPRIRELCGPVYEQLGEGLAGRNVRYEFDIEVIKKLIFELDGRHAKHDRHNMSMEPVEYLNDVELGPTDLYASGSTPSGFATTANFSSDMSTPESSAACSRYPCSKNNNPADEENIRQEAEAANTTQDWGEGVQKLEADACCELCGYRPKGSPQWFKGSMAKHKKLQHSAKPPKIYKCPYPGCNSQYKNRQDNLRQHQIEKNHWAPGEEGSTRRPSKRKKV